MSINVDLAVKLRERAGKGSARAERRAGLVPAVIYGDKKDPQIVTISRNKLFKILKKGGFMNTLFDISIDGGEAQRVLPRDLQLHPVTDEPLHVDFFRLAEGTVISFSVPVRVVDEEECDGMRRGGILNMVRHEIEIKCRARDLPQVLEISLAGIDIGGSAHVSKIKLPDGVELEVADRDYTVLTISAPIAETVEEIEEEFEEGMEGEEGLEGEEAGEGAEEAEGDAAPADDAGGDKK